MMQRHRWMTTLLLAGGLSLIAAQAGAQDPAPSAREWQRAHGEEPGVWSRQHTLTRTRATDYSTTNDANCQAACHLDFIRSLHVETESEGFTNALGETPVYQGTQSPFELLSNPANTTRHAEMFRDPTDDRGCGHCHSIEKAIELGLWNPNLPQGQEGPGVTGCIDCHEFSLTNPVSTDGEINPHLTHLVFLSVEKPLADADSDPAAVACDYCHSESADGGNGSCWNCHLSGHWPTPIYWQPLPAAAGLP